MKHTKIFSAIAATFFTFSAHADLMNISSTSLQSVSQQAIACTIIANSGPTYQGYKVLVAYAESTGPDSNSEMHVDSLKYKISYTNGDWRGTQYLNGEAVTNGADNANLFAATLGRTPGRPTDSALLLLFVPGDAVCAYSRDVSSSSLKGVSVSLTDITSRIQGARSTSTNEIFILEKLISMHSKMQLTE